MDLIALALAKKYTDKVVADSAGGVVEQFKDQLLPEVDADDNNKIVIVENGQWKLVSANRFKQEEFSISGGVDPNFKIRGQKVSEVTLTWSTNFPPVYLKVAGEELTDMSLTSKTLTFKPGEEIKTTRTWTITARDERGNTKSVSPTLNFGNYIYWGGAENPENPEDLNETFIENLKYSKDSNSKGRTISIPMGENQYVWYASPTRLGGCTFKMGDFVGGFILVDTINVKNQFEDTEPYYLYRSENIITGTAVVVVT